MADRFEKRATIWVIQSISLLWFEGHVDDKADLLMSVGEESFLLTAHGQAFEHLTFAKETTSATIEKIGRLALFFFMLLLYKWSYVLHMTVGKLCSIKLILSTTMTQDGISLFFPKNPFFELLSRLGSRPAPLLLAVDQGRNNRFTRNMNRFAFLDLCDRWVDFRQKSSDSRLALCMAILYS